MESICAGLGVLTGSEHHPEGGLDRTLVARSQDSHPCEWILGSMRQLDVSKICW